MTFEFGICGTFDFEENYTGGQSIKTREFYLALKDSVANDNIKIVESTSWKENPIYFIISLISLFRNYNKIIISVAQNGIRILIPFCSLLNLLFRRNLYYLSIGGWLPRFTKRRKWLASFLKMFDKIFVETKVMKTALEAQGFKNIEILENFKLIEPLNESEVKFVDSKEFQICFFSRIMREKGIEDAIQVVEKINKNSNYSKCFLDIYGPISSEYENNFHKLIDSSSKAIRYCGKVHPSESVKILKKYDIQLFPTHYFTEGIPGSIIDSFFAAVPVIASRWASFEEVIDDGLDGIGYKFMDNEDFYLKLNWLINNSELINQMKKNCLKKASRYRAENIIHNFLKITSVN